MFFQPRPIRPKVWLERQSSQTETPAFTAAALADAADAAANSSADSRTDTQTTTLITATTAGSPVHLSNLSAANRQDGTAANQQKSSDTHARQQIEQQQQPKRATIVASARSSPSTSSARTKLTSLQSKYKSNSSTKYSNGTPLYRYLGLIVTSAILLWPNNNNYVNHLVTLYFT